MTKIEQLRADLATLRKTSKIYLGACGYFPAHHDQVIKQIKEKIADLEAQEQVDPWQRAREALYHWDANDKEPDYITKRSIFAYILNLQAKVDDMNSELRCESIDGGKVRDDQKAINAEKNREKLAELTTIANAISPACGLARELVQKRIDGVKREMQE